MKGKRHRCRRLLPVVVGILGAVLLFCSTIGRAAELSAPQGDTPLQQHRQRILSGQSQKVALQGKVVRIQDGGIVTSLSWGDLRAHEIHEGDWVEVVLQGRTLPARIVSSETYGRLLDDRGETGILDVDVAAVPGADSLMVILALSGDLAEVMGTQPGMCVAIERP